MKRKIIASVLAAAMIAGTLAGCGGGKDNEEKGKVSSATKVNEDGTIDTSEEVTVSMYLYGDEGVANKDILAELNKILKEDINTTLEIKYITWNDTNTKYPLLWSSGEEFDMAYGASNAVVPYATLARQDALVDITDMLDTYAPTLKEKIDDKAWESMKVEGKIYGVPSTYSEFTANGFVTRKDKMEEYGVESIESIEDMEKYMDASVAAGRIPLNGDSSLANDMYKMFINTTNQWVPAPGITENELFLVGDIKNPEEIISPVFTDEFEDFAVRMREWSDKGYWSKDVLAGTVNEKDNFHNDMGDAYISHQPDWTGAKGIVDEKLGGVETEFFCFPETTGTLIGKSGVENATLINANSKHPERALMVIEKLMTDKECYDLFQYGIEGRQYEIKDGKITKPASWDKKVDEGGFSGWALRTDEFSVPYATEDERRYTLNEEWKKVAVENPYLGFVVDTKEFSTEISSITNVNSQLGIQILLGKTAQDPKEAVAEYRKQLEAAGIDKVIESVNQQYKEFLESK
ncbi:extracellular solute-binding protein [Blautia sp.]|uniref:extracellular solute-binding protein n=1 Tax=Blautia sp. TaxID=1955243 RepID=UPI002621F96D|nr:extracellular solute-binding protein [Blautia sp.]